MPNRNVIMLTCALWLSTAICGFAILLAHDFSPAQETTALSEIDQSRLPNEILSADSDLRIVLALHPQCPCTRVSVTELERILPVATETYSLTTLAYIPQTRVDRQQSDFVSEPWMNTESVALVKALPNSTLINDFDGTFASELGLTTSGAIIVLDRSNRVLFRGGIAASRSCAVENFGSETLKRIVTGQSIVPTTTPVFGCPLSNQK